MTTYVPAKKNTEYIFYISLVSQSTGQFQSNPTLAAGDFKVSKDGGALANLTTLPAVTPAASKAVKVTLSSTEMNADNVVVIGSDAAGAEWDDVFINIQTATQQIDDLATSAALATVQSDTNDIQTRLPAALSGDGFMKSDLLSINDDLTSGNNATLNLKKLNIVNNAGDALVAQSSAVGGIGIKASGTGLGGTGIAAHANSTTGLGMWIQAQTGLYVNGTAADGHSVQLYAPLGSSALDVLADSGYAVNLYASSDALHAEVWGDGHGINAIGFGSGKKSINATQDIALPSGDLDDQLQTIDNLIDTEVAAIKAKTDQLTFTNANQVDANVQAVNDTNLIGDGSATPWGPA